MTSRGDAVRSWSSAMAALAMDRARDIAMECERDALRVSRGYLASFFSALASLSNLEKSYFALSYLAPRGFLRKETSLKADYEHLASVIRGLGQGELCIASETLLKHVNLRLRLIDFYTHALASGLAEEPLNPACLLAEVAEICAELLAITEENWSDELQSLRVLLKHELVALEALLAACNEIARCRFIDAVIKLKVSQMELNAWSSLVQASKETKKLSSFASAFFRSNPEPLLYQWFFSFKAAAVAKFTLIFASQLQVNNTIDLKTFGSKQQLDLVNKLQLFQRRSEAQSVALIMDASMEHNFSLGFTHPLRPQTQETRSGLNLFPVLFATPTKPSSGLMPGLIMLINEADKERSRIVRLRDTKSNIVFYVQWIEAKLYLAIVLADGSPVLKTNDAETFLNDFVANVRHNRTFALLRPGSR